MRRRGAQHPKNRQQEDSSKTFLCAVIRNTTGVLRLNVQKEVSPNVIYVPVIQYKNASLVSDKKYVCYDLALDQTEYMLLVILI